MTNNRSLTQIQQLLQASRLWVFAISLTASLILIFSFNLISSTQPLVVVGQPSEEDILAPRGIVYESELLTNQLREQKINEVNDVYSTADSEIGRGQLNLSRSIFSFIDVVRSDAQATIETKLSYLGGVEEVTIEEDVGETLLQMNRTDYEEIQGEILRIIDELMREDIRDNQVAEFRRRAGREARLDLTPSQTLVVTNLAPQFIVPTVFFDELATEQQKQAAASAVVPQQRTITEGQRILRAGDIVRNEDVEALIALGLLEQETDWRDIASISMLAVLTVVILVLYWQQYFQRHWLENGRYLTALFIIFVIFAVFIRLLDAPNTDLLYWYPIAAMGMLMTVIFERRFALMAILLMSVLVGYSAAESLQMMLYTAVGGTLAALTLFDYQRINGFFRAGLVASVGYIIVILIFQLMEDTIEVTPMLRLILFAVANGILSSALTLVGFYIMGSLFGVTTTLQLQDLSRLDHPLLRELLRRAPGTYHHSIMVANLAEQAAEEIKANSALIRVGAFYHDIGKMNRPPFFSENQEGINPHDTMDPYTSARIILSHVTDGLELARRYRLPDRIREFIAQHHGTRLVKGFYFKALEKAENESDVKKEQFQYPGPRPQSPETAIVLMADAIESTSRALQPDTPKAIEKLVNKLIDEDLAEGQLDESGLTLGDVRKIRESFIKTLKGRFHVRVRYPGNEALEEPQTAVLPAGATASLPPGTPVQQDAPADAPTTAD